MITEIPQQPMPDWLAGITPPLGDLPLKEILAGSVYYPACRYDGEPIQFLAGNFHSFIYVDYGVGRAATIEQLSTFRGYRILGYRDVAPRELTPCGWQPIDPTPADGNPQLHSGWLREPFGIWAILKRKDDVSSDHGPERFSLLYVAGDGVASFQAMCIGNCVSPAVVAVIQPGHGFGGNWTNFENPEGIFARSVLQYNPAGVPEYLLFGGDDPRNWGESPCWPDYSEQIRELTRNLYLWRRPKDGRQPTTRRVSRRDDPWMDPEWPKDLPFPNPKGFRFFQV